MAKLLDTQTRTPAERIVARFGAERLALWTGRHKARVHAWTWSREKGGTGGVIPPLLRPLIIAGAQRDLGEEVPYAEFEPQDGEAYLLAQAGAA
jgi:hypothetical protein